MAASDVEYLAGSPGDGERQPGRSTAPVAFFSYSREDSAFVLRLAGDLKRAGASVWLDQLDIVPGQRWDNAIEEALAACPRMMVVLSPAAIHSTNVMDEVSFALEEGKTVIPIMHVHCAIPFRLRRVQYIDFRSDYNHGVSELLRVLSAARQDAVQPATTSDLSRDSNHVETPTLSDLEPTPSGSDGPLSRIHSSPKPGPRSAGSDSAHSNDIAARYPYKTMAAGAGIAVALVTVIALWLGTRPHPSPNPQSLQTKSAQTESAGGPSRPQTPPAVNPATSDNSPANSAPSVNKATESGSTNTAKDAGQLVSRSPVQPKHTGVARPPASSAATSACTSSPFPDLCRRAEAGDSHAMADLGMNYVYGRGAPKDYAKAVPWLQRAATAGNPIGMNNLGVMYANGYGVSKDYHQAAVWYRKAAEAGYVQAMANLGSLYENGNGVQKDSTQAITWYRKAADSGNAGAMYDLGTMYENGEGVSKNRQQAIVWYRKSADLGEQHAIAAIKRLGANL